MSDNRKKVLEMLATKKISIEEALQLLDAVEHSRTAYSEAPPPSQRTIKYLRVLVDSPLGESGAEGAKKANIRVPIALIRAGMKFTSLIPSEVSGQVENALKEKGVNLDLKSLKDMNAEELIQSLSELEIDVTDKERVRVFAE